jgi:proline dehydrogenase
MKKYELTCKITISAYTEVYAETLEEAIKIASEKAVNDITPNGADIEENWITDEIDGEPYAIEEV